MHRMDGEIERALYWYRRGAENGNPNDQVVLAGYLRDGAAGFPLDPQEAFRWYTAAAAQRYRGAYLPLAKLKADGIGTERDKIEAYALAEIAEVAGSSRRDSTDDTGQQAKALRERLATGLRPDEIAQAVRRARELRPDLDAIKAGRR
jgi:TPR repeat protein